MCGVHMYVDYMSIIWNTDVRRVYYTLFQSVHGGRVRAL